MDFFAGIVGEDFVMVCSDTSAVHSIVRIKQDENKILPIDKRQLMVVSGEPGDRVVFSEYIAANVKLYAMRNSMSLSTKAVAQFTRGQLAAALRKKPYFTNLLIAGYDDSTGPSLYWLDYLATMHKMNVGGTGYGSYFVLSIFDRLWHPKLTREEALDMMLKGIKEVQKRLIVGNPAFCIKIVDKDGIHHVKDVLPPDEPPPQPMATA